MMAAVEKSRREAAEVMGGSGGLGDPPSLRRSDSATAIRRERIDAQSNQMTAELLQRG